MHYKHINGLILPNAHSLFRSLGSESLEEQGDSGDMCSLASRSRTVHTCIYLQLFYTSRVVLDFYPP